MSPRELELLLGRWLPKGPNTVRLCRLAIDRLPPELRNPGEAWETRHIAETLGAYLAPLWKDSLPDVPRELSLRMAPLAALRNDAPGPEVAEALSAAEAVASSLIDSVGRRASLSDIELLRLNDSVTRRHALYGRLCRILQSELSATATERALQRAVHRMSLPLKMAARELPRYLGFLRESGGSWSAASLGWNSEEGRWDPPDWENLDSLVETIRKEPTVERLARMIGRRSSLEEPDEDEETDAALFRPPGESRKAEQAGGSVEATSVTRGSLLYSLARGGSYQDAMILRRRGWQEAVATAQNTRTRIPTNTEGSKAPKAEDRGQPPVALVLDTSGSMRGEPETVARALAFGLFRHALGQGRRVHLVTFSTALRALLLEPDSPDLLGLMRFLDASFAAGGAGVPALRQVLRWGQREGWREADIVFVTDSREARLTPATEEQLSELRRRTTLRLHGLTINELPMINPGNLFDYTWHYASSYTLRPGISSEQFRQL